MDKQKCRPLATVFAFSGALLLIIALLFSSLQLCMNDGDWFYKKYESYGLEAKIGISTADMTAAIMRLVDYMERREDSIDLTVTENGAEVSMYNEREALHMADVRELYQAWRSVRDFGLPAALILFIAASTLAPAGRKLRTVCGGFKWASLAFFAVLFALGVYAAVDFTAFWTSFHHLFFDNDLWLLSYSTDRMIRICPEQLFSDIIARFALWFLIPYVALAALCAAIVRKGKKADAK